VQALRGDGGEACAGSAGPGGTGKPQRRSAGAPMTVPLASAMLAAEETMRGRREPRLKHARSRPYVRGSRKRARHAAKHARRETR
jgi:hypothetical protein